MSAAKRSAAGMQVKRAAQAHPRQPSARNVEVYGRVRQGGQRQEDVAAELGLSQSRVSRICGQVEAWRRWFDAHREQHPTEDERRAMREQVRQRNEQILELVVKSLAQDPFNRQLLKLAMRAIEAQHALEAGLPPLARFAASPQGREVADVLRSLFAQLQGTARESTESSPAEATIPSGEENYHMPHFMQASAAHPAPVSGAAPADERRSGQSGYGQFEGRDGADYAS